MHCLKLLLLSFLTLAAMSQFSVAQPRPLDLQHQITKPRDEAQTMSLADSQSPDSNPSEQTTAAVGATVRFAAEPMRERWQRILQC